MLAVTEPLLRPFHGFLSLDKLCAEEFVRDGNRQVVAVVFECSVRDEVCKLELQGA